jgi:hypothetical protein
MAARTRPGDSAQYSAVIDIDICTHPGSLMDNDIMTDMSIGPNLDIVLYHDILAQSAPFANLGAMSNMLTHQ